MNDYVFSYTCDICQHQGGIDSLYGLIWACDDCGKCFCERCAELSLGINEATNMLLFGSEVLCPECWHKANPDKPYNAPKKIVLKGGKY